MEKRKIYLLGLITLLVFPLPTFFAFYFSVGISPLQILHFNANWSTTILYGLAVGIAYALIAFFILQAPIFQKIPLKVTDLVKKLNLNYWDAIFLSVCAGFGEELIFRVGIQHYLGIYLTSFLFVAVHGYFSLKNPLISLYGFLVLPLALILGFGYEYFGFWFSATVHFAYDLVIFITIIGLKKVI
jgi:hypothetical protein